MGEGASSRMQYSKGYFPQFAQRFEGEDQGRIAMRVWCSYVDNLAAGMERGVPLFLNMVSCIIYCLRYQSLTPKQTPLSFAAGHGMVL